MPGPALVPLIAAGSELLNSGIAAHTSRRNTDRTIAANYRMAEYAYSKDLEMWQRNNEYNSPQAQMARLKAAGLNPNLVYGNGAVGNSSGSTPKFQAPTADFTGNQPLRLPSIPETLGMYQDFKMRQAQIENIQAQTENVHSRTINESFRKLLLEFGARSSELDFKQKSLLAPHQLTITENEAQRSEALVGQAFQQLRNMSKDELIKRLEIQSRQKGLTIQDLEIERKKAENLYLKYRNEWRAMGVTEGDHPIIRILSRMLDEAGVTDMDDYLKR
jgi:hypothetical protein